MPASESWVHQGRQEHGEFGHGTSPKDDKGGGSAEPPKLFQPENASQRVTYVASSIVGHAPRSQRSRWEASAGRATLADLKTAMAAWYGSAGLSWDTFRDRFLDPMTGDEVVDKLRTAARETINGPSYDDLAQAGNDFATAVLAIGPDRWPRYIGSAARNALAAADSGLVPAVCEPYAWAQARGLGIVKNVQVIDGAENCISNLPTHQRAVRDAISRRRARYRAYRRRS